MTSSRGSNLYITIWDGYIESMKNSITLTENIFEGEKVILCFCRFGRDMAQRRCNSAICSDRLYKILK